MAARAQRVSENALPSALADRLARIAWIVAHSHGLALDDVLSPPPFTPSATRARMMAIAAADAVLRPGARMLGLYFRDAPQAIRMACDHAKARCEDDRDFAVTFGFLKSSCG